LKNCWYVLITHERVVTSSLFEQHVKRRPVTKLALLLCHWKQQCVLFLWVGRVATNDEWFINSGYFFSSSFFFYARKSVQLFSLFLVFKLQSLFFWFLIFILIPLMKVLFVFNLIIQLQFLECYFFFSLILFLCLFLFSGIFVKVWLTFNFIIQSKFILFYLFQFGSRSFDLSFLLLKLFFISISPSNLIFFCLPSNVFFILIYNIIL
jgi:hypothetical protein